MAEVHHHDLPLAYHSLLPLPTEAFPIFVRKKDKLDWRCITCGGVTPNLSLNNMEASPEPRYGTGCRYCRSAKYLQSSLESATYARVLSWHVDANHPQLGDQHRDKEALQFKVTCPRGHHLYGHASQVKQWQNKADIPCPICSEHAKYAKYTDQVADIQAHWASAVIESIGCPKWADGTNARGQPLYRVDIPGVDAPIGPSSAGRLRGSFTGQHVTERRLRQVYKKDLADRDRMEHFISLGQTFGSEIYAFIFSAQTDHQPGQLMARYRTVAGNITPPYNLARANAENAGRTGLKLTQTMMLATLVEMFPADIKWFVHDRTELAQFSGDPQCRYELDIGTPALVDGGLWVEYQGDQSHRHDPDVIHRDQLKAQWCDGQALLLQIPELPNATPDDCIEAIHAALERHPDTDRVAQARAHLKVPSTTRIWDRYMASVEDHAVRLGIQLEQAIGTHGHQMLTPYQKIIRVGTYTIRCGYCGHTNERNVTPDIHSPPQTCSYDCSCKLRRDRNREKCRQYFQQYPWWPALPDRTKEQIIRGDKTITCGRCDESVSRESIKTRDRVFCTVCEDTGVRQANSSAQAAAHRQHADSIEQTIRGLIADFDLAPCDGWRSQVSYHDDVKYLTLTTENGPTTLTVDAWRQEYEKTMSKHRHAPETRQWQLAKAYPNLRILHEDNEIVTYWCGCATEAPDGRLVAHPVTQMRKRNRSTLYNAHGGELADVACYIHSLRAHKKPSVQKSIGDITARWRLRAAIVGDHHIPHAYQRTPTATLEGRSDLDPLTSISTSQNHVFYCADRRHAPITRVPDNMFNKYKTGYCRECIEAAGQQGFNLNDEENKRRIVPMETTSPDEAEDSAPIDRSAHGSN